jgi:hypothetical protein
MRDLRATGTMRQREGRWKTDWTHCRNFHACDLKRLPKTFKKIRERVNMQRTIVDCPSRIISWNLTVGKLEESTVRRDEVRNGPVRLERH